jgi:hypothetical protein
MWYAARATVIVARNVPNRGVDVFTRWYAGRGWPDWALTQLGRLPSSERFQEPRAAAASV